MSNYIPTKKKLSYERSFASYEGKTKNGKLKVECWNYEENKINPRDVSKNSHKICSFKCDICVAKHSNGCFSINSSIHHCHGHQSDLRCIPITGCYMGHRD